MIETAAWSNNFCVLWSLAKMPYTSIGKKLGLLMPKMVNEVVKINY